MATKPPRDKPLSLAPLTPEQAIHKALNTPLPGKGKKKRAKPKGK